jgi:hypothetical protein
MWSCGRFEGPLTDMFTRRTLLGAPKWAFRDLRRELARAELILVMAAEMCGFARCEVVVVSKLEVRN